MARSYQDPCLIAIQALAHATLAAMSHGMPGTANAAIEAQYLISSRIRPGLAARHIYISSYATFDYTVRGLEAQISSDLVSTKEFECARRHAESSQGIKSTIGKTLCLMKYATCLAEHFTATLEERRPLVEVLQRPA